jgi:hypothetical protein
LDKKSHARAFLEVECIGDNVITMFTNASESLYCLLLGDLGAFATFKVDELAF